MNMVPPQNLHAGTYGGGFAFNIYSESFGLMSRFQGYDHDCSATESCKGSDPVVASFVVEDESRTNSLNETGSSSKDVQDGGDKGWLRLSIGRGDMDETHIHNNNNNNHHHHHRQPDPISRRGFGLTELDLLPAGASKLLPENDSLAARGFPDFSPATNFATPSVLPQPPEVNWTFRPISHNIGIATSSSNNSSPCSSFIPFGSYFPRPFQLHTGLDLVTATAAGPSSDTIRVIDPPRRPHSGIWFTLQPLENQGKQPVLPPRSSSYLRIKDGRMTVRLLIKYLVKKLRLDCESEIEIRCRGEKLEGCLTMQHIRDNIWCSSSKDDAAAALTLLPHSSTIDHIMVLHYATTLSPSSN